MDHTPPSTKKKNSDNFRNHNELELMINNKVFYNVIHSLQAFLKSTYGTKIHLWEYDKLHTENIT